MVFGASGDLASRKLLPAIAALAEHKALPDGFTVVGVARTQWSDDQFRQAALDAAPYAGPEWKKVVGRFRYVAGEYAEKPTFDKLKKVLGEADAKFGTGGNRVYYLATIPSMFGDVASALAEHGCNAPGVRGDLRPHRGREALRPRPRQRPRPSTPRCTRAFDEDQIFRIDHYLGKETVQNVLALRFGNAIFEPIWNRRYVDHIQITVAEELGVEHRGGFYETAGALRDIVQNHVMQVLALTLMEPPATVDAQGIRDEKVKLLRAVMIPDVDEAVINSVRGQYAAGAIDGDPVVGLPRGGGRRRPEPHRDLRGAAADGRQLALGRGPGLHPHRQAPPQACHRGRPAVPASPPPRLRGQAHPRPPPQHAGAAHPARRRDLPLLRGQGPRGGVPAALGGHGLHLRRGLSRAPRRVATSGCCTTS